jgi:hypothetical protein
MLAQTQIYNKYSAPDFSGASEASEGRSTLGNSKQALKKRGFLDTYTT